MPQHTSVSTGGVGCTSSSLGACGSLTEVAWALLPVSEGLSEPYSALILGSYFFFLPYVVFI